MRDVTLLLFMLIFLEDSHSLLFQQPRQTSFLAKLPNYGYLDVSTSSSSSFLFRTQHPRRHCISLLPLSNRMGSFFDDGQQKRQQQSTFESSATNTDSATSSHHNKPLEEDIAKRLSLSRDQAISALSQPVVGNRKNLSQQQQQNQTRQSQRQQQRETTTSSSTTSHSLLLSIPQSSFSKRKQQHQTTATTTQQQRQQNPNQQRKQRRIVATRATLKRHQKNPPNQSSLPRLSSLLPPLQGTSSSTNQEDSAPSLLDTNNNNPTRRSQAMRQPYSSLLPPPLPREMGSDDDPGDERQAYDSGDHADSDDDDDALSYGLSSWEEFLGGGKRNNKNSGGRYNPSTAVSTAENSNTLNSLSNWLDTTSSSGDTAKDAPSWLVDTKNDEPVAISRLPSIRDLFPPDFPNPTIQPTTPSSSSSTAASMSSSVKDTSSKTNASKPPASKTSSKSPTSPFDGILPVSDLFYRSSQSIEASEDGDDDSQAMGDDNMALSDSQAGAADLSETAASSRGDDEELPFSAEQSDQLTTDHNKIRIRRNTAAMSVHAKLEAAVAAPATGTSSSKRSTKGSPTNSPSTSKTSKASRRRGLERMVRRGMEMLVGGVPINADPPQRCIELIYRPLEQVGDWSRVITLNSRDFGPLLDSSSAHLVTDIEKGLFCEYFVQAAMKWDVCPKDLKDIVKQHFVGQAMSNVAPKTPPQTSTARSSLFNQRDLNQSLQKSKDDGVEDNNLSLSRLADDEDDQTPFINGRQPKQLPRPGFPSKDPPKEDGNFFRFGGDLVFDIGVSREELESGNGGENGGIVRQVLGRGISAAIDKELEGFLLHIAALTMTDKEDGTTSISAEFCLHPEYPMSYQQAKQRYQRVKAALAQAMDDGDMQLAMAAAAREETGWDEAVRDRVVEEFLFEEDEVPYDERSVEGLNESTDDDAIEQVIATDVDENDDFDQQDGSPLLSNADLFIGGGSEGVFFDYSAANIMNAPYQGELGPRLLEVVADRAKQRQPRVIAIGDVHGCIDELQDLLRQCEYQPGDLVVFLGDMVIKGPDSSSVVQMAREIGAIGVRGNHDFEVIRWHQAIKSGVDPPVVGSEHFHIASCLSKAEMKWLHSLPWYISSKELGALFVHAGFVSGIRLAKQNPRLMMNMRSILPDGTVTSKFFNNWPWARLWDGPQTVLFGHDADRGLQQYEHAIGLDTGCVYGGRLTACILPEKRLVSVCAKREYFKYRRKHYD